jgi:uncharacterized membrane protein YtjA (UPF0391 family)
LKQRSASLHAKYLIVLALAIAGAIPYGCHAVWSAALGGGIQLLNLDLLSRSVRAVLSAGGASGNAAALAQLTLVIRTVLFFTAVIYVLTQTSAQPLPFLVGLLVIVPAGLWHGLTAVAHEDAR